MKAVGKVEKGKATTIQIVAPIGKPACITMREALRHKLKELGEELDPFRKGHLFDARAKEILQEQGYDAIYYPEGTLGAEELHIFVKPPAVEVTPTEAPAVTTEVTGKTWFRGTISKELGGDTFWSASESVAGDYGTVKVGEQATIRELTPNEMPQNPYVVKGGKEELAIELGIELGMAVTPEGGSYNPTSFTVKVQFAVISDSGETMNTEARNFQLFAEGEGLSKADLFKPFIHNNITHKLIGMTRRGKYTILGQREDGKVFKFLPREIRKILGRPESLGKAYFKPDEDK